MSDDFNRDIYTNERYLTDKGYYLITSDDLFNNILGQDTIKYPYIPKGQKVKFKYDNVYIVDDPYWYEDVFRREFRRYLGLEEDPYSYVDRTISPEVKYQRELEKVNNALAQIEPEERQQFVDNFVDEIQEVLQKYDKRNTLTRFEEDYIAVRFEYEKKEVEENLELEDFTRGFKVISKRDYSYDDVQKIREILNNPFFKALGVTEDNIEITQIDDEYGHSLKVNLDNYTSIIFDNQTLNDYLYKYKTKENEYVPRPKVNDMVLAF